MMINWNRVVPSFAGDRSPEEMKSFLEARVPDPDRMLQGYYYSKPLSAAACTDFILANAQAPAA